MRKGTIILAVFIISVFTLCGCHNDIENIEIINNKPEIYDGEFAYGNYSVVVNYNDGHAKTVALTAKMIVKKDRKKLKEEGKHIITVSYLSHKASFELTIKPPPKREKLRHVFLTRRFFKLISNFLPKNISRII